MPFPSPGPTCRFATPTPARRLRPRIRHGHRDRLLQGEDVPDRGIVLQGVHERQLGRPGVAEEVLHPFGDQGLHHDLAPGPGPWHRARLPVSVTCRTSDYSFRRSRGREPAIRAEARPRNRGPMESMAEVFLLTRDWRDTPRGIELVLWATGAAGPVRVVLRDQEAVCFIPRAQVSPPGIRRRQLALATLAGTPVDALYFRSRRELEALRERPGPELHESDVRPVDRFLMERFVTGPMSLHGACGAPRAVHRVRRSPGAARRLSACPSQRLARHRDLGARWRRSRPAALVDRGERRRREGRSEGKRRKGGGAGRQAGAAREPVPPDEAGSGWDAGAAAAGAKMERGAAPEARAEAVFIVDPGASQAESSCLHLAAGSGAAPVHRLPDETAVLKAFLAWVADYDPDLIIGWNVAGFDLRFLEARCRLHRIGFTLGRDGGRARVLDGAVATARVPGRVVLDGIEGHRAAFWGFEDESLGAVARELLGRGKLIAPERNRVDAIRELYETDKLSLAAYNLEDCRLVREIFDRTRLVDFMVERSRIHRPRSRADRGLGGRLRPPLPAAPAPARAGRPRHRRGRRQRRREPRRPRPGLTAGPLPKRRPARLQEPLPEHHPDVPHRSARPRRTGARPGAGIRGSEVRARGRHPPGAHHHPVGAPRRGEAQRRPAAPARGQDSHELVLRGARRPRLPLLRSAAREQHHDARARDHPAKPGVHRGRGFRRHLRRYRLALRAARERAGAPALASGLAERLNAWWRETLAGEHRLESCLEVEFETLFERFLMPTVRGAAKGTKKRYAGLVRGDHGGEPELVFKGLETVRTDWTPLARRFQRELYRKVFLDEPYEDYVRATCDALLAGELDGSSSTGSGCAGPSTRTPQRSAPCPGGAPAVEPGALGELRP